MPVYFGIDPPRTQRGNATKVSEALERKGIKLIRASPSDLTMLCFPLAITPVLSMIIAYFSALVHSLAKTVSLGPNDGNLEVTESHPSPFPINLPPLAVALKSSNDKGHEVLTSNGFEMVTIQGKDVYLNGSITKVQLRAISEDASLNLNRVCYAPVGFCNLSSMGTALDLIALFSFAAQLLGLGVHGGATGSEEVDDYDIILEEDDDTMEADGNSPEITLSLREFLTVLDISDQAKLFNKGTHFQRLFSRTPICRVDSSVYQRRNCFFSPDQIPSDYSGFLFRYVKELAIDDQKTVPSFVQRYLLRNLGGSNEECVSAFSTLCSSWGNLRDTTFGYELTHIAKCISLTLDLNASIYPLFDAGFYEGCVVRCSNASMSIGGNFIKCCTPSQLASEMSEIATHKRTLDQIALLAVREGALATLSDRIKSCTSMVELRSYLVEAPISEATKEGILAVAPYLRFPARSWSINAKTMEDLCGISESLSNLKIEHPISFRALLSTDSIEVGMSCFDDRRCPSLISPSGTSIDLKGRVPGAPTQSAAGDKSRGKQRVSDAAWTFTIRRTTFEEAVSDLRKVIYNAETRSVSSSSARGTGAVVFRKQQFVNLFGQLQKLVSARGKTSSTPVIALESQTVIGGASSRQLDMGGEPAAKRMRF